MLGRFAQEQLYVNTLANYAKIVADYLVVPGWLRAGESDCDRKCQNFGGVCEEFAQGGVRLRLRGTSCLGFVKALREEAWFKRAGLLTVGSWDSGLFAQYVNCLGNYVKSLAE